VLSNIANYFPVRHMIIALVKGFENGPNSGFAWHDLLVMAIWAVAGLVFAVRRFRWEPRHR
jgi:hypothetical protein